MDFYGVSESEILEMQNSSLKQVSFTVGCSDLWIFWGLRERGTEDKELQPKAGQLHSRGAVICGFLWSLRERDTGDAELQPQAGQLHSRVQ